MLEEAGHKRERESWLGIELKAIIYFIGWIYWMSLFRQEPDGTDLDL